MDSGAALDICSICRVRIYPLSSFRGLDIVGFLVVGIPLVREH